MSFATCAADRPRGSEGSTGSTGGSCTDAAGGGPTGSTGGGGATGSTGQRGTGSTGGGFTGSTDGGFRGAGALGEGSIQETLASGDFLLLGPAFAAMKTTRRVTPSATNTVAIGFGKGGATVRLPARLEILRRRRLLVSRRGRTGGYALAAPADAITFADVIRGPLRLLLSGPTSSGARATPADATTPGRNRIHLIVDSLDAEIERLRDAGVSFRSDAISGPGGRQILLADPAGNLIELFQPAQPATSRKP